MADRNIYITDTTDPSEDGSIDHPYDTFSDINWTTSGDNSIFDWVDAGDDVYINLKRGCVWREQLTVGTSGASGYPVTIQAYGTGADPIIDGRTILDTLGNWADQGGNIWLNATDLVGKNTKQCWIDDTMAVMAANAGAVNSTNKYYWDNALDELSVYATSNPATAYTNPGVEVSTYHTIIMSGKSYIVFDGLHIKGGFRRGLYVYAGCTHITVQNCTFTKMGESGAVFVNESPLVESTQVGHLVTNNTITYDLFDTITGYGIGFGAEVQDSIASHNTITNAWHAAVEVFYIEGGDSDSATTGNIVEFNTLKWDSGAYYGSPYRTNGAVADCHTNTFRFNYIENSPLTLRLSCPYNSICYNIWNGGQEERYHAAGSKRSQAIGIYESADNYIYNNIIYGVYNEGIFFDCIDSCDVDMENNIIRNNIIMNCDSNGSNIQIRYDNVVAVKDNVVTNNCIYSSATANTILDKATTRTVANADANMTGWDNNIASDPKFRDVANGDFKLNATSPCRDAGVDVSLTSDYVGRTVPKNHTPDIGAYELFARGVHKKFYNRLGLLL